MTTRIHIPDANFYAALTEATSDIQRKDRWITRSTARRQAVAGACRKAGPLLIHRRDDLTALGFTWLGVRSDWHEPDEQGLTARVEGNHFDNAMTPGEWYGPKDDPHAELHVILSYTDEGDPENAEPVDVAVINLATLLGWASRP